MFWFPSKTQFYGGGKKDLGRRTKMKKKKRSKRKIFSDMRNA